VVDCTHIALIAHERLGLRVLYASFLSTIWPRLTVLPDAAQGGDLGAFVACHLARSFPACKAYHINLAIIGTDGFDVDSLDDLGKKGLERGQRFMTEGVAYADEHCQRTSTISHVLASNPVSLFAWIAEKWNSWSDESPSLDHVLDSITFVSLYCRGFDSNL
jgi:hypothetical protein